MNARFVSRRLGGIRLLLQWRAIALATAILLAGLAGCDRGPQLIPATGKLTFRSKPVPNADIVFVPDAGGTPVIGRTSETGEFVLNTNGEDGAYVGSYKVAVTAVKVKREVSETEALSMTNEQIAANHVAVVPIKYNNTISSGLTATVTEDPASNTFELDLK
jgi:hypothetical protein